MLKWVIISYVNNKWQGNSWDDQLNMIWAIDVQESSGFLKDQISTPSSDSYHEAAEGKLNNTTPCETIFTADYISLCPWNRCLCLFDATTAKLYDADESRQKQTETRRYEPAPQEVIKKGLDELESWDCLWNPSRTLFLQGIFFPAKTVFSVLRFLTRLLRRLEFRYYKGLRRKEETEEIGA